jgi:hypothetical protein
MLMKLPSKNFKWANLEDINLGFIEKYNMDKNDKGYVLECDLEVPEELHDKFNDYPLAPESIKVKASEVSEYSRDVYNTY